MGEPEEDTEGYVVEDDLGQMLREAEEGCETEKESRDLKHMLEDYRTLLYPKCKQDQKKLGTTLELLQWKSSNLDSCPVCNACWYKIPRDDPGDVEGMRVKKRVPAKVM